MHKKALSVAIAGALAVPMAAQAIDFTISGHVNRALFITDTDDGTNSMEADNGSSGSRIRAVGSGEMANGTTAGVTLEYGAGGDGGDSLSLRFADLHYGGDFGKVSIGHGEQAGESSVYNDKSGVLGIGHGQAKGDSKLGDYFGSLDGGDSRINRIRYDTPSVGPFSAAISVGQDDDENDNVSGGLKLTQDFGGTAFSAAVGAVQWGSSDKSTLSASAGAKLPSGGDHLRCLGHGQGPRFRREGRVNQGGLRGTGDGFRPHRALFHQGYKS